MLSHFSFVMILSTYLVRVPFGGVALSNLHGLQVRPLMADHLSQELLLQASLRHCEVNEGGLCLQLGREVRVGQLCVQKKPESAVILTISVSQLDKPVDTLCSINCFKWVQNTISCEQTYMKRNRIYFKCSFSMNKGENSA